MIFGPPGATFTRRSCSVPPPVDQGSASSIPWSFSSWDTPTIPNFACALMAGSNSMSAQRSVAAAYWLVRLMAKAPRLISWLFSTQARCTPSGPGKIGTSWY